MKKAEVAAFHALMAAIYAVSLSAHARGDYALRDAAWSAGMNAVAAGIAAFVLLGARRRRS